jgi:cytochrome P450 family 142 subfamily A polypeptide 1
MNATHPVRDGLNLLDGSFYAQNPHEVWAWMRREAPVYWDDAAQVWGISRYEDVLAIEKDPLRFSNRRGPRPHMEPFPSMIAMDDPEHKRRRALVSRGFTPRRVSDLEEFIADLCERIVDDVCELGECDFVWDVAARLPLLVIAHLLGFEDDLHDDLLRWSDDMVRATNPTAGPELMASGLQAALEFREHQLRVIEERRLALSDGLVTTLCQAEIDGERLDNDSIVQETLLLLLGGDETTRHVLSGGMLALLASPEQLSLLQGDLGRLPVAIEELLRYVSPVQNMARTVRSDVELRGQHLHIGDQLLLFYPSANRDEAVFVTPDGLDLRREPNPHLAFGFGAHYCLGSALARLELRFMFREVLTRLPDLRLAVEDASSLPRRASNFITGVEAMPVRYSPAARFRGGR